jgi:carbon monoxide dehydrogenase subunit G
LRQLIKYNKFAADERWHLKMRLQHTFEIPAPVDEVWRLLLDLEQVAPCLPGASLGERIDESTYDVAIKVKLGPMQLSYAGRVEILEQDDVAKRAVMRANTTEQRGQGTAEATITTTLSPIEGGTRAEASTQLRLTGRVAQMGGIVEDVSNRLLAQFSEALGAKASAAAAGDAGAGASTGSPEPRPIGGLSLAAGILLDRLRRLVGRGGK